jgi:FtsZ-binding cell division protein ZapB
MWQIEWMLNLIPDTVFSWITAVLFFGGVLAYIVSKLVSILPFVGRYKIAIELSSLAAMIVGAYFFCGVVYRSQVAELKEKVRVSEEKSRDANTQLDSVIKSKNQIVKETRYVIQERIVQDSAKIDAECRVPREAVDILNKAAETPKRNKQ